MPNVFSFLVLFGSPVLVFLLFKYLPRAEAFAVSIIAGYLFLPTRAGLDLPLVPPIDKDGLPILTIAALMMMGVGAGVAGARRNVAGPQIGPHSGGVFRVVLILLMAVMLLSPLITVTTNYEVLVYGPTVLPPLRPYDGVAIISRLLIMVLPFLLALRVFSTTASHVVLLRFLVLGMLVYTLPALYEIRMSPQLNVMFYGFFPHEFAQHIRPGGFRPVVFLTHGLWLAILFAMAILGAAALWRQRTFEGARAGHWFFAGIYLSLVLLISNNLGALVIAVLLGPVVLLLGVRTQLVIAAVIAGVVLVYPMLRGAHLVPVDAIVSLAEKVSVERADSLRFRLENEDVLADWASQKPLAGWGGFGRNGIYDPVTGREESVTDGAWIIIIGVFGWLGYIAQFGLLTLPIIFLALRKGGERMTPATAGLAVVLAANLIDLIPNATQSPVIWMVAGALSGYAIRRTADADEPVQTLGPSPVPQRQWALVTDHVTSSSGPAMTDGASPAAGGWVGAAPSPRRSSRRKP
jgi:hypothetical protein